MTGKANKKLRFKELYDQLLAALKDGSLGVGQKIPAERDLAEQAGISYMTARQAVQALVDKGYLVRKPRVGTFVPFDVEKRLSLPTVNVIMPVSSHAISVQFERVVKQQAKAAGLNVNLLKVDLSNIDAGVRLLGDSTRPCILLMSSLVREPEFRQAMLANTHLILVGYNLSGIGIESVLCDDAMAARMAYTVLQQAGHKKIALAIADLSSPISQQVLSGWKSCHLGLDDQDDAACLIDLDVDNVDQSIEKILTESLRKGELPFSAVITSTPDVGIPLCNALESMGLSVPDDISIVTLGIEESLSQFVPKLTCIDPHLDKQIQYAVDSCLKMRENEATEMLHLVTPEIFDGESVKNNQ